MGTRGRDDEDDKRGVAGDKGAADAGCAGTSGRGPSRSSIMGAWPAAAQGAIVTGRRGTSMSATCQLASAQNELVVLGLYATQYKVQTRATQPGKATFEFRNGHDGMEGSAIAEQKLLQSSENAAHRCYGGS